MLVFKEDIYGVEEGREGVRKGRKGNGEYVSVTSPSVSCRLVYVCNEADVLQ